MKYLGHGRRLHIVFIVSALLTFILFSSAIPAKMTFDSGEEELLLGLMAGFFTANFYGFILWFGAIRYYSQLLSFLVGMIGHAVGKVAILFSRDESWLFVLVSFIISVLVALVFY